MRGKNDSSNIQNLFGGGGSSTADTVRKGSVQRKPPPFMTDPEMEKPNEEKMMKNLSEVENRIEQKLREIDGMMVHNKILPDSPPPVQKSAPPKVESPFVKAGQQTLESNMTLQQKREINAQKFKESQ